MCGVADGHECLGTFVVSLRFRFCFLYILSRLVSDDCGELATQFFDFVFCFGGFSVPSFDPYVFPLYDQHILRNYYTVLCINFFCTPPCVSGEFFMHFWFHCMECWFTNIRPTQVFRLTDFPLTFLSFFPPYLYGFQGVFGSFVPSPLWARNRLFLPVAGRVGSTLFLCVRCLVLGIRWFGLRFVGTDAVIPVGLCYHSWRNIYIFFLYRLSIAAHVCRFFTHCRCLGTCA